MAQKKLTDPLPSQISLIPPVSLSPSPTHRLSHKPTSSHALPFLPIFSVWLQYFLVLEIFFWSILFFALLFLSLSRWSPLFSDIYREEARRICEKSVCKWWTAKLRLHCLLYELEKSANRSPASAAIRLILYWYACRSWVWTISRAKISPLSPSSNSSSIAQQVNLAQQLDRPDFISEI